MKKKDKKQSKEYKKVMLFDAYSGWSLAFSIAATLAIIWMIVYAIGYDPNKSYAQQLGGEWFVIVSGIWIIAACALFIVNVVLGAIYAKRAWHLGSKVGFSMYIVGMFIPYVGFGYQIDNRRTLIHIGNRMYREGDYEKNKR